MTKQTTRKRKVYWLLTNPGYSPSIPAIYSRDEDMTHTVHLHMSKASAERQAKPWCTGPKIKHNITPVHITPLNKPNPL